MTVVSVVYHSGAGHTAALAQAVADGAGAVTGVNVKTLAIVGEDIHQGRWQNEAIIAALDASDAIIFGAPTYMGDVSGPMKCFLDWTGQPWFSRAWVNKLAAGFTVSMYPSGDKLHSLQTFVTVAMQLGMLWIGHTENDPSDLNRLGSWTGVIGQANLQQPPSEAPNQADLRAGSALGRRVAETSVRWRSGI